jgi:photosystem II stability/assembly factor-like uncharacterized protein
VTEDETRDYVYAIAASPDFGRDGICFAARRSGLFRSEDGGFRWQDAYRALELPEALLTPCVAVSPDFRSDHSVLAGASGGILRSVDGGRSWQAASVPTPPPVVSCMGVSPNFVHDGALFAGTMEDGVLRSTDRGSRWQRWNFGLLDLAVFCLAISPQFAADDTLFVGTDSGLFRSTNGGRAWREVSFPDQLAPVLSLAVSPDYARDGTLWAGTESNGLYVSTDRGDRWRRLAEELIADTVNAVLLSPQFPAKADVLAMLPDRLLISRDGGGRWSTWPDGLPDRAELSSVAAPHGLDPGAPLLVGLTDGRVLRV